MKHVHAMDIRPDVIIKTGVIQPYSITEIPPTAVARHVVSAFANVAGGQGPQARNLLPNLLLQKGQEEKRNPQPGKQACQVP